MPTPVEGEGEGNCMPTPVEAGGEGNCRPTPVESESGEGYWVPTPGEGRQGVGNCTATALGPWSGVPMDDWPRWSCWEAGGRARRRGGFRGKRQQGEGRF